MYHTVSGQLKLTVNLLPVENLLEAFDLAARKSGNPGPKYRPRSYEGFFLTLTKFAENLTVKAPPWTKPCRMRANCQSGLVCMDDVRKKNW
jgi:hypothetical protein